MLTQATTGFLYGHIRKVIMGIDGMDTTGKAIMDEDGQSYCLCRSVTTFAATIIRLM